LVTKKCFKCGEVKDLDSFYGHPQTADKHLNKCKTCSKWDAYLYRVKNVEKVRAYEKKRAKLVHRKAHSAKWAVISRERHPYKYQAHCAVNNAVRDKKLLKPEVCSACGNKGTIAGHHDDYSKPLDVRWLCYDCHRDHHLNTNP
jgi:ribosomal protein S27AE